MAKSNDGRVSPDFDGFSVFCKEHSKIAQFVGSTDESLKNMASNVAEVKKDLKSITGTVTELKSKMYVIVVLSSFGATLIGAVLVAVINKYVLKAQ